MEQDRIWYLVGKKLAGEATAEELAELEDGLRNDPGMHYAMQNITDIWQLPSRPSSDTADAYRKHLERMKHLSVDFDTPEQPAEDPYEPTGAPAAGRRRRIWAYAMTVLILASGGVLYYGRRSRTGTIQMPEQIAQRKAADQNEITTRFGSKTKIKLPDGSQVWLNAGSSLRYDKKFDNEVREVELSGEAFFDVATNPNHPFIIHTQHIDVKVLGTTFNVKSYPGENKTETSLIKGKVEVSVRNRPEEKFILKPNEKLVVTEDGVVNDKKKIVPHTPEPMVSIGRLTYQSLDSTIVETAWVQNKLVFDDEPFRDIAARMERWYGVHFEFLDAGKESMHLTGSFTNETVQQALDALRITAPFHYKIAGNEVIITK